MTLTLVLFLAPHLSTAGGTRFLFCVPHVSHPPGLPPTPDLEVQHHHKMPFDFVLPTSKAKPLRSTQTQDASTASAGKHASIHNASRTSCEPFPKPVSSVLPMSRLAEPKSSWQGSLVDSVSDLVHHQYRLSVLQWNPGPGRKNPPQILPAVWTLSCCYPSVRWKSRTGCLGPVHHVHRRQRPRHLAQQRHVRTWRCGLLHLRCCCDAIPLQRLPRSRSAQSLCCQET